MDGPRFRALRSCVVAAPMPLRGSLMGLATIGSVEMMAIADSGSRSISALHLAVDSYIASLRRAFPAEPWRTVKYYAERAWFAADLAEVPWEQVEARIESAWDKPVSASPAARQAAADSTEYATWPVARRALQDDVRAGRQTLRDPAWDYGMHG